jgi:hypothetical protein
MGKDNVIEMKAGKPVKDLVADQDRPDVTKITVEYSDGTVKELKQGVTMEMGTDPENPKAATLMIEALNLNGEEFITLTQGMFTLACQILGINDEDQPECKDCGGDCMTCDASIVHETE